MGNTFVPIDEKEAWLCFILAICSIDNKLDDEEINFLSITVVAKKQVFDSFESGEFGFITKRILSMVPNVGGPKEMARIGLNHISDKYKKTVFVLACEVALMDGNLSNNEIMILTDLAKENGFEPDFVSKIIEVSTYRVMGSYNGSQPGVK
jgi:hypothetical protein